MRIEILGWLSSFILVLTIGKQIYKQWQEGSSKAVSKWLFLGQMAASTGFLVYSIGVWSPVFIVTNALMMLSAIVGFLIVLVHRKRKARGQADGSDQRESAGEPEREYGSPALARR